MFFLSDSVTYLKSGSLFISTFIASACNIANEIVWAIPPFVVRPNPLATKFLFAAPTPTAGAIFPLEAKETNTDGRDLARPESPV